MLAFHFCVVNMGLQKWPTVKSGLDSRTGGLTDLEDFVIWHTLKRTQLAAGSQEQLI